MKPKSTLLPFLALAASSLMAVSSASAATGTWNVDSNGLWGTDTKWASNIIADGLDSTANFTNNITADRTVSLDTDRTINRVNFADSNTATAGSWILDNNGTSTNNLILSGTTGAASGTVPVIDVAALGTGKTATISAIIEGSYGFTKTGAGTLVLSDANTYTGTTTVNGGTLRLSGNRTANASAIIVNNGATLEITAGNFSVGGAGFYVSNSSGVGTVNHSGGTITVGGTGNTSTNGLLIGNNGRNGTYNLNGGTLSIQSNISGKDSGIRLGVNGSETATFNLSSGTLTMASDRHLQIGRSDGGATNTTNLFSQTGGTATVGILRIGGGTASSGVNSTLRITAGTFTAASFTVLGGTTNNTALIEIGGTADVTLPAFATTTLGTGSTATIRFDGGVLKNSAASTNYFGSISSAQIKNGGAKFNTTGGDITISHVLQNFTGDTGSLTKEGTNTLTLSGTNTYTGATTVLEGVLRAGAAAGGQAFGAGSAVTTANTSGATLDLNGFNQTIGSLAGGGTAGGNVTLGSATLTTGGNNTSTSYAGVISGTGGGLTKTGGGTFTLTGANTYTGATTVSAGTLLVNGDNSAATGAVSVAAGATNATAVRLKGTGTVGGNTTFAADPDTTGDQVGGIHSPGASVGKQTFDQAGVANTNLTYNTGSIFEWELAATPAATAITDNVNYTSNRGTAYDAVNVTGTVSGSGAIFRIVLDGAQTFADAFWSANKTWTDIFRNGDGTDSANVSNWASVFGGGFQYYNYSGDGGALTSITGPTGGSFSLSGSTLSYNFTAIPEPSSALAGLLLTAGLLRRRRGREG